MAQILIAIFLGVLGTIILYQVIQSAIDNSRTAYEIREIRRLLQKQIEGSDGNDADSIQETEELDNFEILDIPFDLCPACGAKILPADKACSECGLSLDK